MGQLSIAMQPSTPAFASLTSHLRHLEWHGISQYSILSCGLQTQDLVLYGEGSGEKDLDRSPRDWCSSSQAQSVS